ncbi:MAG: toxic anion resistance protein, partial [Oscillospiraceae bacterium]|nr:toxic anion resistance protein [Oscillospiraceae bacterium]
ETLTHTNQELINTLDEVKQIQTEGREKRRAAEAELGRIENEIKNKLLEVSQS